VKDRLPGMSESQPTEVGPPGNDPDRVEELMPLAVSTTRIVLWGELGWVVALVLILAVPALHEGGRDWWPWVPVAGIVLGLLGLSYVRRGRGNAAGAE
jgi:hypothetical protein